MRKIAAAALALFLVPVAFAAPPAKPAPGSMVIVFKDGHRQSFNLAEIERVEFPVAGEPATASSGAGPSRSHYVGKWEVGDGQGNNFYITLWENGDAYRSLGNVHGKWTYADGEARATWNDGNKDAIRRVGSGYQKAAYGPAKSFSDNPDNVANAVNTAHKPI